MDNSLRRDHADISGGRSRWFIAKAEMAKRAKHQLVPASSRFPQLFLKAVVRLGETERRKVVIPDMALQRGCRVRAALDG